MDFLLEIVQPNIWVFTAIDSVHSEQFGDPSKIAAEEVKMIKNTLEFAFLNVDDTYAMWLIEDLEIDYLTYQTQWYDSRWDIVFDNERFIYESNAILVEFTLRIKEKSINISTNLVGKAHYGYIGVALAILDIINYKEWNTSIFDKFDSLFLEYKLQSGRFSVLEWQEGSILFDSTYNASPLSMKKVLNTVHNIRKSLFPDREIWLMLGDMRELWDLTESDHRKLAAYVHSIADKVFLVWESMGKYMMDELEKIWFNMDLVKHFDNSIELWEHVKSELMKSDSPKLIVWKGSQNTIFLEEAIKILLENQEDVDNLTRQSDWWMKKKAKFFLRE